MSARKTGWGLFETIFTLFFGTMATVFALIAFAGAWLVGGLILHILGVI